jgi:enoyl-CoA hydratase/carnithine racemase
MNEILTERSGGVLTVQLNRPAKKNAITTAMYAAFAEVLEKAAKDDATHVVLIHGAGDSFTAGNDLEDFLKNPPGPGESPQMRLFAALNGFDKPIVAAVHGVAVGFGTTMLVHCDFVYAGESARFITPFIDLALVPEMGSSSGLPGLVGRRAAAEMLLLGTPFAAGRAEKAGLVTAVVPDQALLQTATQAARKLAEKPIDALIASKKLLKRKLREHLDEAGRAEVQEFAERVRSPEAREAFDAFFHKRRPDFAKVEAISRIARAS